MTPLQIKPIHYTNFDAEAVLEGSEIAVRFTGTADLGAKAIMDGFLGDVHGEATRMNVKSVSVDVSGLEFINSSCLMAIVTWITTVQSMTTRRYHIAFHFKAVRDWHRRSFDVFTQLGEDVVTVQPSPPPRTGEGATAAPEDTVDETTRLSRPRRP